MGKGSDDVLTIETLPFYLKISKLSCARPRIYNFLSQFASTESKNAGKFYNPRCVVKLLVVEPHPGWVHVPCCGSGGK